MDDKHIQSVTADYAKSYPASINIEQAAEIAAVSKLTIYDWSSRGELDEFKSRRGRRVRFCRDAFVRYLHQTTA